MQRKPEGGASSELRFDPDAATMPAYSQTQITDAELGDLQAYLRTIGVNRRGGSDR